MNEIVAHSVSRHDTYGSDRGKVFDSRAHAVVIKAIARETGTDEVLVGQLYEQEWTELATRAKISNYLTVFAERSVRSALRASRSG